MDPSFHIELPLKEPVAVFTTVLLLLLFAPFLFRKLRVPGIIGLILSGMLIGPNGLGLLERDSSVELFSTIGLLYIMFLAGLELELNEFLANKNQSIAFGFLTFAIPFSLGFLAMNKLFEMNSEASVLIGLMMASYTLVAYPIASRLGIHRHPVVMVVVGGTIVADSLVLILLAVVGQSLSNEGGWLIYARMALSMLLYLFVVFRIFPRIARWFFRSLEGESNLQFIFVLALLFVSGLTAEWAGFEPIIGAFMCGLVLNPMVPKKSDLSHSVEFVGQSLFIPFFLLSVGMLVDLRSLQGDARFWLFLSAFLTLAIGSKWLAAFVYQKIYKKSSEIRDLVFGLSTSHAAATIAVVMLGYESGLVGKEVLNAAIMLIFLSSLIGTIVTDRMGRKIAPTMRVNEENKLGEAVVYRTMVPLSNPSNMSRLLDLAIGIHTNNDLPVVVLSISQSEEQSNSLKDQGRAEASDLLEKAEDYLNKAGIPVERMTRVDLNAAHGIVHSSAELDATDIILGWNERTRAAELLYGTVLQQVLRRCTLNCWVFRQIQPLHLNEDIGVVLAPMSGLESGFVRSVEQLRHLSAHLSSRLHVYGKAQALSDFMRVLPPEERKAVHLVECELGDSVEAMAPDLDANDLIVLMSAREGTLSYKPKLAQMPALLSEAYPKNNIVLLFPEQREANSADSALVPLPTLPDLRIVRSLIGRRSGD